jgi:hypothetical protein
MTKFKERISVTGRGTILIASLCENGYERGPPIEEAKARLPKIGSIVYYENIKYEVRGIEMSACLMYPPFLSDMIGLQVKEVD